VFSRRRDWRPPTLEEVRKNAHILVIDDQVFPAQSTFTRDGYHIERWSTIKNLSQLTDDHYDLILLDLHGVGLRESPDSQGIGILEHIKSTNPTQIVIAYSAQPWSVATGTRLAPADAVLDKGMDYIQFKSQVDELLLRRRSPGYFISVMNAELGDSAADAPMSVQKALAAMGGGRVDGLRRYLEGNLTDPKKIDRVVTIISIGVKAVQIGKGVT
jgi:CheY-like chemotaxis protein